MLVADMRKGSNVRIDAQARSPPSNHPTIYTKEKPNDIAPIEETVRFKRGCLSIRRLWPVYQFVSGTNFTFC